MKQLKILMATIFFVALSSSDSFSQLQSGFHYRIKENSNYKIFYTSDSAKSKSEVHIDKRFREDQTVKAGLIPSELKGKENLLVINFWPIKDPLYDEQDPSLIDSKFELNSSSFFFIETTKRNNLGTPNYYRSIPYRTWETGVTTIPLKIRMGGDVNIQSKYDGSDTTFTRTIQNETLASINAGMYFGHKWGRTKFYSKKENNHNTGAFTLAGFFGPTAISINDKNTTVSGTPESTQLGLSFGAVGIFSYRGINLGVFYGYDFLANQALADIWYYNGKPWIGFGIGYKIKMLGEE